MKREDVEGVYATTHMQQGMLFHGLYSPDSGAYITQTSCLIEHLDVDCLRKAWAHVLDDTPMLRTAFVWKRIEDVKQVVVRPGVLSVPIRIEDWSGLSDDELQRRTETLRHEDRARGFAVSRAPLMRITLCKVDDKTHWLLWTIHHLLVDGWSQRAVLSDVFEAYARIFAGAQPVSAVRPPFSSYITWLASQDIEAASDRWRAELAGYAGGVSVGVDRAAAERYGSAGTYVEYESVVSEELAARLRERARASGVTLNTVMQGAWALLLSRYSRRVDVVFGAVSSGRTAPVADIERMIGMLINTLPVRARIAEEARIDDWLIELHRRQGQLRQLDFTPIETVNKCSELPAGVPLYDSVLVFENLPDIQRVGDTGTAIRDVRGGQRVNYPLVLVVWPWKEIGLVFAYDTRRFSVEAIKRMSADLVGILRNIADGNATRLAEIQVVSDSDAAAAVGPELQAPGGTVVDLLMSHARDRAGSIALCGDAALGDWTYGRLARAAETVAARLVERGVRCGDRVAIDLKRSNLLAAAFFGVMRVGALFVAMDPAWPSERKAYAVRDSGATCVICGDASSEYAELAVAIRDLDSEGARSVELPPMPEAHDAAYMIYTSGSTGTPKGVVLRHGALMHSARELARILDLSPSSRLGQFTSVAFDGCVGDVVAAAFSGCALCLVAEEAGLSGASFQRAAADLAISAIMVPPSYLAAIDARDLPLLSTIVSVGEPLGRNVVKKWQPGRVLLNGYGPTEMTICTTLGPTNAEDEADPGLGAPVAATTVYLLDENLRSVVPGAPGEMYIHGPGEATGYWERRGLTAERFVPNPYGPAGSRMYRSGDIGRRREDGTLEFVGRIDQQVKVRGYRVELGEVEHKIKSVTGVKEAVVLAERVGGEVSVTAFVELEAGRDSSELRAALSERLPQPMIPGRFVETTEWPRTGTGKLNRLELLRRESASVSRKADSDDESADSTLNTVRAVWKRVLKLDHIGDDDDFFEVAGGDSLSAVRMVSQLEKAFGTEISVRDVFREPTIRALVRLVTEVKGVGDGGAAAAWEIDSELDAAVEPISVPESRPPRRVLVTGATGFVGSWVVRRLLERGDTDVACLARSEKEASASARVHASLVRAGYTGDWERCKIIEGALDAERLGLAPAAWNELATEIDGIVHLGAWVNYLHPYERLRKANVEGTRELLRLTAEGNGKRFIHGSTLGMFAGEGAVLETTGPPDEILEGSKGYTITKVVSERIVWKAIEKGLAGTICRMPDVVGDSRSGASNDRDLFFMTFAACLALGVSPQVEYSFNALPVDYVAEAITRCLLAPEWVGSCVHICHDDPLSLGAMMRAAVSEGYAIRPIPLGEWLDALGDTQREFRHLKDLWLAAGQVRRTFDRSVARRIFEGDGLPIPRLDDELLRRYVRAAAEHASRS